MLASCGVFMKMAFAVLAIFLFLVACAPQAPSITPSVQPKQVLEPQTAPLAPEPQSPDAEPVSAQTVDVDISGFRFVPAVITIKAGDTVRWTNKDSVRHTATADDQSFDTGLLAQGQSGEITFDKPGEYEYHCTPHPGIRAKVIVE